MSKPSNEEELAQLIQSVLDLQSDYRAHVVSSGITLADDYWEIPVWVEGQPPASYGYYGMLADVETDIEEKQGINVLLVPAEPPQE